MVDNVSLIKEKIELVEYVSRTVSLKKAGQNFRGLCPFHKEKTPSFNISPDRQVWHCFGCQRGGDLITYVMEAEHADFKTALEILANQAGITLKRTRSRDQNQPRIFEVLKKTAEYYQNNLQDPVQGQVAIDYLTKNRGLSPSQIKKFQLGYSPNSWNQTGKYLLKQGFRVSELITAGLVIPKKNQLKTLEQKTTQQNPPPQDPDSPTSNFQPPTSNIQLPTSNLPSPTSNFQFYDRFRHRVMFPIHDHLGRVVGFSGRTLDTDQKQAKYINSPETSVFKKNALLYGLHMAKEGIHQLDHVVLVEGQLDVIAMHKIGVTNAVAPQGTALTESHLRLIRRFTKRAKMFFDQDEAGIKATNKAIESCLRNDIQIKIAPITNAQDPDESARNSPNQTRVDLGNAVGFYSFLVNQARSHTRDTQVDLAVTAAERILPYLKLIPQQVTRETLVRRLADDINVSFDALIRDLEQVRKPMVYSSEADEKNDGTGVTNGTGVTSGTGVPDLTRIEMLWRELAAIMLQTSGRIVSSSKISELLDQSSAFYNETQKENPILVVELVKKITRLTKESPPVKSETLNPLLSDQEQELADLLSLHDLGTMASDEDSLTQGAIDVLKEIYSILIKEKILKLTRSENLDGEGRQKLQELTERLREIQRSGEK